MRIQQISMQQNKQNINCKSVNQMTKFGIGALITSSSLFIFTNAMDSFESSIYPKNQNSIMKSTASALGIIGTALSLTGLSRDEKQNNRRIKRT